MVSFLSRVVLSYAKLGKSFPCMSNLFFGLCMSVDVPVCTLQFSAILSPLVVSSSLVRPLRRQLPSQAHSKVLMVGEGQILALRYVAR